MQKFFLQSFCTATSSRGSRWRLFFWNFLSTTQCLKISGKVACGQTVIPDRSILIGQKMVEIAKIPKFKCDILSNFQTLCTNSNGILNIIKNEFLSKKIHKRKIKVSHSRHFCRIPSFLGHWIGKLCLARQITWNILAFSSWHYNADILKIIIEEKAKDEH